LSVSRPGRFTPGSYLEEGWVGPRDCPEAVTLHDGFMTIDVCLGLDKRPSAPIHNTVKAYRGVEVKLHALNSALDVKS